MFKKRQRRNIKMKNSVDLERKRERRNKIVAVLNKYSLLFHAVLACGVCFLIEWISRHSFVEACYFVVDRNLVFLYNSLIVFSSLMLVYMVRRRAVLRTIICAFWLFLGTINGCILAKRVSPFSFTDLKMVGDLFTMQSNYFTAFEAVLVIVGVVAVIAFLVIFWFKGPKFEGRLHKMTSLVMIVAVVMMLPNVTNAAVSNHILTSYFENLAQGYKDYGFVYSFSASVLDRGMSAPEDYSEESVNAVLEKMQGNTAMASKDEDAGEQDYIQAGAQDNAQAALSGPGVSTQKKESVRTTASNEELNTASAEDEKIPEEMDKAEEEYPNIICVLLESFV
ncbi:MAG: hypothetical protein Q4C61_14820, partial [Lachnospiraceae bacterium]|nr:hypothetical protein [Lachnospiraceae bacterium]